MGVDAVGSSIFTNLTIADYSSTGFFIRVADFAPDISSLVNSVFVAQSVNNGAPSNQLWSSAVYTPYSDGFKVSNIRFYNFPTGTTAFRSYSEGNIVIFFEKIKYTSVLGNYVGWGSR